VNANEWGVIVKWMDGGLHDPQKKRSSALTKRRRFRRKKAGKIGGATVRREVDEITLTSKPWSSREKRLRIYRSRKPVRKKTFFEKGRSGQKHTWAEFSEENTGAGIRLSVLRNRAYCKRGIKARGSERISSGRGRESYMSVKSALCIFRKCKG